MSGFSHLSSLWFRALFQYFERIAWHISKSQRDQKVQAFDYKLIDSVKEYKIKKTKQTLIDWAIDDFDNQDMSEIYKNMVKDFECLKLIQKTTFEECLQQPIDAESRAIDKLVCDLEKLRDNETNPDLTLPGKFLDNLNEFKKKTDNYKEECTKLMLQSKKVYEYFGEDPKKTKLKDIISSLYEFSNSFEMAAIQKETKKKQEAERKEKLQQAEIRRNRMTMQAPRDGRNNLSYGNKDSQNDIIPGSQKFQSERLARRRDVKVVDKRSRLNPVNVDTDARRPSHFYNQENPNGLNELIDNARQRKESHEDMASPPAMMASLLQNNASERRQRINRGGASKRRPNKAQRMLTGIHTMESNAQRKKTRELGREVKIATVGKENSLENSEDNLTLNRHKFSYMNATDQNKIQAEISKTTLATGRSSIPIDYTKAMDIGLPATRDNRNPPDKSEKLEKTTSRDRFKNFITAGFGRQREPSHKSSSSLEKDNTDFPSPQNYNRRRRDSKLTSSHSKITFEEDPFSPDKSTSTRSGPQRKTIVRQRNKRTTERKKSGLMGRYR